MKRMFINLLVYLLISSYQLKSQTLYSVDKWMEYIEEMASETEDEERIEALYTDLSYLIEHPFELNTVTEGQLKRLPFLSDLQIRELLEYRSRYGKMLTLYELKNVEAFDLETISLLVPFIYISEIIVDKRPITVKNLLKRGSNNLQIRYDRCFQQKKGYCSYPDSVLQQYPNRKYLGEPFYHSVRYSYEFDERIQFGLVAEKDVGEPFWNIYMKSLILSCMLAFSASATFGQGYQFTEVVTVPATPVKNQAATGTCWCFATTSFMESELLRMGKGTYDLSEMFIVRQKYMNQLQDNYLRRGDGNIGQGSLSHTFMNAYRQVGIVPEEVYTGINYDSEKHNHSEMVRYMHAIADVAVKAKQRSPEYDKLIANLFDTYLGKLPEKFTYKGKEYTPKSFAESLGLNMDDYIELTSFTHHPYYVKFDVEVPDNWEHSLMYNLPLDEMMQTVDYALNNGYTVCWDGDVSEKGFSFTNGVAINPEVKKVEDLSNTDRARFEKLGEKERLEEVFKFERPYPEINVTPEVRQAGFESFVTTDDHLMHLTGIAKDQNGTKYYITKNSWGTDRNKFGGYLNMSESFVRAKTIYVMVHKDAIPKAIKGKLHL